MDCRHTRLTSVVRDEDIVRESEFTSFLGAFKLVSISKPDDISKAGVPKIKREVQFLVT